MYQLRPALAVTAALSLITAAAAAPAVASTSTASHGSASSDLRLLHVAVAQHAVSAGEIAAQASNAASPHVADIVVTPAALDGTTYGQQTVTPATSPVTVPSSAKTATLPGGLGSVTGPTFAVTATDGTTVLTSAVLKALGSLTVGPLPVSLDASAASLTNTAEVTSSQASAEKSVVIGALALPSVTDLLDALNINPLALVEALTKANLDKLNAIVNGAAVTALNTAVDTASSAIGAGAPTTWKAADAAKTTADASLATATANDTAANAAWTSALTTLDADLQPAGLPMGLNTALTPTQYEGLSTTVKSALDAAGLADPNNFDFATLAQDALNADAVKAAAQAAADKLAALVTALFNLAAAVLNDVGSNTASLARLGSISVTTKAIASAKSPAPVAEAKVGTLSILGAITPPAALTTTLNGVLAQLSSVLNSIAGVSFTPPSVAVGVGHTSRSVSGKTATATASITGVTVTLPKLTLPTALDNIPVSTTLISSGGSIAVATLSEGASYTSPAVAGSPASGGPSLAGTGMSYTVPVVAVMLVLAGLAVVRRRRFAAIEA